MSAAVYFSGALTVPQIFLGDYHIGGAEDLEQLQETQRFSKLMQTTQSRELGFDSLSDTELAEGAMDQPLRAYIPQSDGSRDTDPEALPILRFYKAFLGFGPIHLPISITGPKLINCSSTATTFQQWATARKD